MCKPLITHRHLPQIAEKVNSTATEQERRQVLYEQLLAYFTLHFYLKALEKVVYDRLSHCMYSNNILIPEQLVFRNYPLKGTIDCKCCIQANTQILSTQVGYVGGIFCEFAKAFYEILRAILHFYGIQGTAAVCIITYLTNIQQRVNIHLSSTTQNFRSDW